MIEKLSFFINNDISQKSMLFEKLELVCFKQSEFPYLISSNKKYLMTITGETMLPVAIYGTANIEIYNSNILPQIASKMSLSMVRKYCRSG